MNRFLNTTLKKQIRNCAEHIAMATNIQNMWCSVIIVSNICIVHICMYTSAFGHGT